MIRRRASALETLSVIFCCLTAMCITALLLPTAAVASEGGGDAASSPLGWLFRWINFAIVFLVFAYLFAKKTPAWFRGRAEQIGISIREAAQVKESAEQRLREAENKLAALDAEISRLRAAAGHDATAERARILAAAKAEAERIQRAAQLEIAASERAAKLDLKKLVAGMAIERAEASLRKQVTPQADAALVRAFVTGLESRLQ